ncbi:WxL protein peptidoglycan domain-containing protein [Agromyces sp. Marseille-Q5079]|uniref:WxL protein peptidoglycan domain-containing protein n=1 Tax=Agromyces sp. Marseille-Q5079 TaxID=3439059 RepID=UPI003D9C91A7
MRRFLRTGVPTSGARAVVLAFAGVVCALAVVAGSPVSAWAEETPASVSWSVSPADATGPDGRSRVELDLDPGASATEHLAVHNLGDEAVTFAITAADGYLTSTGRFNMLPSDQDSVDAGTWISVADSVTIAAGSTAIVPFTVAVPENATPGDHAAGIAASVVSTSTGDGARVGVESRVGFRVMTRVTGELAPAVALAADGRYVISWNPFRPGRLEVTGVIENTGNVALAIEGAVESGGERIAATGFEADESGAAGPTSADLLPGEERTLAFGVPAVWPLGVVTVPVTVEATAVGPDGTETVADRAERTVTVWALPLPQSVLLVAVALIVLGIALGRRRRSARIDRLVEDAREEGRRAALGGA